MSPSATRLNVRELVGWTILSAVVTLSKFAVWVDGTLGERDLDADDERS